MIDAQKLMAAVKEEKFAKSIANAVPVSMRTQLTPDRVAGIVYAYAKRNPTILECGQKSILQSINFILTLGLEPGGPNGEAYLVPYKNKKGERECQPIIGYRGYIALARRGGKVRSIFTQLVYENDEYKVQYGDEPKVHHIPRLSGDRGRMLFGYCVAHFTDGGKHIEVMTKAEIDKIQPKQPKSFDPWLQHYSEMARKTVVRRASKYLPLDSEAAEAFLRIDQDQQRVDAVSLMEESSRVVPEPGVGKLIGDEAEPESKEEFAYGPPPMDDDI